MQCDSSWTATHLIVGGKVVLLLTVRDGNDIRRLVYTALQFALVALSVGVGVFGIERGIARLAESRVVAIGTINRVKEGVEEAWATLQALGIVHVVGLEENRLLGIRDGI
jgi:hypothetical protein